MRKIYFLVLLIVICIVTGQIHADTVYMADGRIYRNVSKLRIVNAFVIFKIDDKNYSISKQRIKKIIDASGDVFFEKTELTAEIVQKNNSSKHLAFYKNKKKLGIGTWDTKGEFKIISGNIGDGVYRQYYDSGKLMRTFTFKNGKLNGLCKVFYKSGKVEKEGIFSNNKEKGTSKLYYNTGVLKGKSNYSDGKKEGITTLYYESGNVKAKMNFKDDEPDGLQKMFYESGAVETKVYFKSGVKDGPIKQYYENGKLRMTGQLVDGKLEGQVTTYYESGRIKKKVSFHKGRIFRDK